MRRATLRLFASAFLLLLLLPRGAVFGVSDFYWEYPEPFVSGTARFPVSAFRDGVSAVAWQESSPVEGDGTDVSVSLAVKRSGEGWRTIRGVAGPYRFSGSEPSVASIAVDGKGRVLLAVSSAPERTEIVMTDDFGESFSKTSVNTAVIGSSSSGAVAPRIFVRADGGYLLFATRGIDQTLSLFVSRSDDGKAWTPFESFVTEPDMRLNFLPSHAAIGGRDFIVFQSLSTSVRPTFHLFLKSSADGGETWTPSKRVSVFRDPYAQSVNPETFDNQRPNISVVGGSLHLVWERRSGSQSPQVYIAEIDESGNLIGEPDRITSGGAYCNNPLVFEYDNEPTVVWFDNRRGEYRAYLAQRSGVLWQETDLTNARVESTFVRPAVDGDGLFLFWQAKFRGADRLMLLGPDMRVDAPTLAARNFTPKARTRRETARISWTAPGDPSGISGYSYLWTTDPDASPPKTQMVGASVTSLERVATEDGSWYFSVMAHDFAGNWSEPARMEFVRDTTPPGRANVVLPPIDEFGYLLSNSFTLEWNPPPASDLAGFAWELEYVAPLGRFGKAEQLASFDFEAEAAKSYPKVGPLRRLVGPGTSASFVNRDDGIWRFTVSAVDEVGNVGEGVSRYFRTNKYIPYTYVTFADAARDDFGVLSLRLVGRGFSQDGNVERIFLDQDGRPPYDREFLLSAREFRVDNDRTITGLRADDLPEGRYRIGLVHPVRGLYLTAPLIVVDETGTVKFGDYTRTWEPTWVTADRRRFVIDSVLMLLAALIVFSLFGAIASVRGIGGVLKESFQVRTEVAALLTGDLMPSEKKALAATVRKRGGGLRLKLAAFTAGLVVAVVVLVSIPLSLEMTRTQEETLVQGLKDRSRVLLESLASGARAYLPSQNVLELGFLPAQTSAVPEARYATITGFGRDATTFSDHVWATNDPRIAEKIDTAEFRAGISRIEDPLSGKIQGIAKELDDQARKDVGDLSASIAALTQEGLKLALRTDAESVRKRDDIQTTTRELEARLSERLSALASRIGSEPSFDGNLLPKDTDTFIFYKPVMFRQGAEDLYFRGLVRLEVGTESIFAAIAEGRRGLIRITGTVALIAVAIGVFGALLLASLIVRPLKRLVAHVEMIRDTEDKSKLEGQDIVVKSKDEIAVLGDTINAMTHGLVKAAVASADLTVGKEVQKMFIPLDTDALGRKLTCGRTDTPKVEFFGYYEGAKGVSGDYFDYLKLDDRYFAIIKCDVAGKGVPAALIMIEVATLFLNFFKYWKPTKEGMRIERVVYQINDFIESRGFKGRFAAFTLCLFDSDTGDVHFCNAGDNLVHIYDSAEGRMKVITLPETPTAGVFPNDLIEMKGGYQVKKIRLKPQDILLLYSDGIEEAKRRFRDARLQEVLCAEPGLPVDSPHGSHTVGQGDEEMGYERVEAILNSALSRGRFELVKYHNADPSEKFTFDFSQGQASLEEAIMALVSVEKVFRIYRDPKAGDDTRVIVDRRIDAFLKNHFEQYRTYCSRTKDHSEYSEYMYYTHLREDEQYDDLTILGIRKK